MALQVSIPDSDVGPAFPEAYARVVFFRSTKDDTLVLVYFHADAQARIENKEPVKKKEYLLATEELEGKFYPAMYAALKTLPDFAGAVDV